MTAPSLDNSSPDILLSLPEIAAWQLNLEVQKVDRRNPICAELPALQRGAVWSAEQTETLWDSLLRGFPVGAFVLAPYQPGLGHNSFKLDLGSRQAVRQAGFLLLDGQQRATAIAVGFLDLWLDTKSYADGPALWIDLEPPPDNDDRRFVFRLLTRSHPWGYGRIDPKKPLEHRDIRKAIRCFCEASDEFRFVRAAKMPLRNAWPWDAKCPLPFALLLASAGESDWRQNILRRLQNMPMFNAKAKLKDDGVLLDRWKAVLTEGETDDRSRKWGERLEQLVEAIRIRRAIARIPALILPMEADEKEHAFDARKDDLETLFIRVNSAGTRLGGEELIYSALKAVWPAAPQELERLQPNGRHIVTPARLVGLIWRFWRLDSALSEGHSYDKYAPGPPAIGEFRKALRDEKRRESFDRLVKVMAKEGLVSDLLRWVRLDDAELSECGANAATVGAKKLRGEELWRLPPTLAAQLFAGDRGQDILFIALAWLRELKRSGRELASLTSRQRQRSLGFIVSLNWFALRPADCVARLWKQLVQCPSSDIEDFFNARRFQSLLLPNDDGKSIMLPVVPPHVLKTIILQNVEKRLVEEFDGRTGFWAQGSHWAHFDEGLAPKDFKLLNEALSGWLESLSFEDTGVKPNESTANQSADDTVIRRSGLSMAWRQLLEKMWWHRPLIDYAQRAWLQHWFPDFDPTFPGQMEDMNRPWDYDHIHPSGLLSYSIPTVIREWHRSIGNLRAWPLELNRGDQAEAPREKLSSTDEQTQRFGIGNEVDIRRASFIDESSGWEDWKNSVPTLLTDRYLTLSGEESDKHRSALLRAITGRFCSLHQEWYEGLALSDLAAGFISQ